jgi:hypothetical protein
MIPLDGLDHPGFIPLLTIKNIYFPPHCALPKPTFSNISDIVFTLFSKHVLRPVVLAVVQANLKQIRGFSSKNDNIG